jgi:hypothetical protein
MDLGADFTDCTGALRKYVAGLRRTISSQLRRDIQIGSDRKQEPMIIKLECSASREGRWELEQYIIKTNTKVKGDTLHCCREVGSRN